MFRKGGLDSLQFFSHMVDGAKIERIIDPDDFYLRAFEQRRVGDKKPAWEATVRHPRKDMGVRGPVEVDRQPHRSWMLQFLGIVSISPFLADM